MSDLQTSPLPIFTRQDTFVAEPGNMSSSAIASEDEDETTPSPSPTPLPQEAAVNRRDPEIDAATIKLRRTELLALVFCVLSPLMGGSLLHYIREFLSRPSEGVVSTFNITLFVMAAEIRPAMKLMEMIKQRSLHLQNVVHRDMLEGNNSTVVNTMPPVDIEPLNAKIEGLENAIEELRTAVARVQGGREEVVTGVREGIRADVEALNRPARPPPRFLFFCFHPSFADFVSFCLGAVRRYEKNFALHRAHTEDRINLLSSRVNDLSLIVSDTSQSPQGLINLALSIPDILIQLIQSLLLFPKVVVIRILHIILGKRSSGSDKAGTIDRAKSSSSTVSPSKGTKSHTKRRVGVPRSE